MIETVRTADQGISIFILRDSSTADNFPQAEEKWKEKPLLLSKGNSVIELWITVLQKMKEYDISKEFDIYSVLSDWMFTRIWISHSASITSTHHIIRTLVANNLAASQMLKCTDKHSLQDAGEGTSSEIG